MNQFLDSVEVHELGNSKVSPVLMAPMPIGVYGARAVFSAGELWVLGGQCCERVKAVDSVYRFNFGTGCWSQGPNLLRARRFMAACALSDGGILVCGGQSALGEALRDVERWSPELERWLVLPQLPTARYSHACCLLPDGRVGVFGSHTRVRSCEALDPYVGDSWAPLPSLCHGRAHLCAAVVDSVVLVIGGTKDGGVPDEQLCFSREQASSGTSGDKWLVPLAWAKTALRPPGKAVYPLRECGAAAIVIL